MFRPRSADFIYCAKVTLCVTGALSLGSAHNYSTLVPNDAIIVQLSVQYCVPRSDLVPLNNT